MDVGVGVAYSCRYMYLLRVSESIENHFCGSFKGARFRITDFLRAFSNP